MSHLWGNLFRLWVREVSEAEKRFDTVVDRNRNVLCFTTTENVVEWLKKHPEIREGFWVRVGDAEGYMSVQDYLRDQGAEDGPLSETRIRRIIREELVALLNAACKKADVPKHVLPSETLEDALVVVIETLAKKEAEDMTNRHEDSFDHIYK